MLNVFLHTNNNTIRIHKLTQQIENFNYFLPHWKIEVSEKVPGDQNVH